MSATAQSGAGATHPAVRKENLVRVYVWQWPIRVAHWLIFYSILVLAFTGYYMYKPFIISRGNSVFVMATMRFVHEVAAFVFIAALLLRFYWFFKGNRWARWRNFRPWKRWWWHGLRKQVSYYLFLRRDPDSEVGHNPLAAATYAAIYALMVAQICTGMALLDYAGGLGHGALDFFFGWVFSIVSVGYVREIHFLIMFAFIAFMIHHVYSAVVIGLEERSGLVSGMFTGYKFFPAAFVAADPTRPPDETMIPAAPGGLTHRLPRDQEETKKPAEGAEGQSPRAPSG